MSEKKRCDGYRTSGYWKGHQCCAIPKYEHDGKWYCKNHLPLPNISAVAHEVYMTTRVLPDDVMLALTSGDARPEDHGMVKVEQPEGGE